MNLNDLGRAAYEAANAAQAQFYSRHAWVAWELLDSNDKRANGLSALAAVERFVSALDDETDINTLLSSLRAEANTDTIAAKQQKGS